MLDPGDRVVVEDPGYRSAQAVFVAAGARLAHVRVDDEGLDTRRLPARARHRLVYVTPSHQFPLGVPLSLARRLELLHWADEHDAWVIEDDYDSEFRYDGRPLATLHSLTPAGRVLYVGTYNKVLFPGLRLAYLILPDAWVPAFSAARRIAGTLPSSHLQATLAEFMATGRFAAYLRQSRLFYARCRDRLVGTIARAWDPRVTLGPSSTGLHVTAQLPRQVDDVALARAARRQGLSVVPLSRYHASAGASKGLVISYGAADPARLEAGVTALARTLDRALALR
jgi:GntR family transcriptional regulator/MocR family aminotransferase